MFKEFVTTCAKVGSTTGAMVGASGASWLAETAIDGFDLVRASIAGDGVGIAVGLGSLLLSGDDIIKSVRKATDAVSGAKGLDNIGIVKNVDDMKKMKQIQNDFANGKLYGDNIGVKIDGNDFSAPKFSTTLDDGKFVVKVDSDEVIDLKKTEIKSEHYFVDDRNYNNIVVGDSSRGSAGLINDLKDKGRLDLLDTKPKYANTLEYCLDGDLDFKISVNEALDGKSVVWRYETTINNEVHKVDFVVIKDVVDGKMMYRTVFEEKVMYMNDVDIARVDIGEFTGSSPSDMKLADAILSKKLKELDLPKKSEGYTWHHDMPCGQMILIKTSVHKKFDHAGGFSFCRK